jgi:hypothetical protein
MRNLSGRDTSIGGVITQVDIMIVVIVDEFTIEKRRNKKEHQNTTDAKV